MRQRTPMQHPNVDRMAEFFAADPHFFFKDIPNDQRLEERVRGVIESYLPGDIRQWYNSLSADQKVSFTRGVLLGIQRRAGEKAGGALAHLWDAFIRPETLRPEHDRVQGVTRQRTGAEKGSDENPGQRRVGVIEGFGNFFTTPLRALTATVLTTTAPGRTFGRESGTPTFVTDWASVYAADPSWGSVLEAWWPNLSPFARQIVGGGLNMLLDPLNLLGLAQIGKATNVVTDAAKSAASRVPGAARAGRVVEKGKRLLNDALETSLLRGAQESEQVLIGGSGLGGVSLRKWGELVGELAASQHTMNPTPFPRPTEMPLFFGDMIRNARTKIGKGASTREVVDALVDAVRRERNALAEQFGEQAVFAPFHEDRVRNLLYLAIRSNDPKERAARIDSALAEGIVFRNPEWKGISPALMFRTREFINDAVNELPETIAFRKAENPNLIERAVQAWKATKTSLNFPAGAVRNFFQNFIYRWLTGDVNETELARGIVLSMISPKETTQLMRQLRTRVASDPQLASPQYFARVAQDAGEKTTQPQGNKVFSWLRERFGDADLLAAAVMARGKKGAPAEVAASLVPDYARVPTVIQDLARMGILPFGHWGYYALTGVGRGLRRAPHRSAKLVDAFTAGRGGEREYQYTDIPGTDREIRTDIIAPFELGAGSEIPIWALEQNPLINLGQRIQRGAREDALPRELIGFLTPPVLNYYLPNLIAEWTQMTPEQREQANRWLPLQRKDPNRRRPREVVDLLLGLFGFPVRPQDPLRDAEEQLREAERELKNR